MNNDLTPNQAQPPKQGGKFKFLLIALAPLPVGLLLIGLGGLRDPNAGGTFLLLGVVSLAFCIYGSIGMLGGYENKPRTMIRISGVMLGIALCFVEAFIVVFVGCVASFKGF